MKEHVNLSIVSSLYLSSATVQDFVARISKAAKELVGEDFEIVLVDDGSPDDGLEQARAMLESIPQLVIVELTRNFGHHLALLCGLERSKGQLIFLIDSDLEEDPEWLLSFHSKMVKTSADVVYGFQEKRKGRLFERFLGAIYWRFILMLTGLKLPANMITCRLMTRQYLNALLLHKEVEVSIGGLFALTGFHQVKVPVIKGANSTSTYSLHLKIWHLVNSVTAFSARPLQAIFMIGLAVTLVGLLVVVYLVTAALVWNEPPEGWTSVMASVWIIGGMVLASQGTMAIYLGKVFAEIKGRPRTIVRREFKNGN